MNEEVGFGSHLGQKEPAASHQKQHGANFQNEEKPGMAHHQHKYGNKIGATLENIPRQLPHYPRWLCIES